MKKSRSPLPSSALYLAMEHHRAGRLQQAEALYKKQGVNGEALHLLGLLYQQQEKHAEALAVIGQAVSKAPARADYYFSADQSYRALNRIEEMRDAYLRLLDVLPDNAEARLRLAHAYRANGQAQLALDAYLAVLEVQPEHAEAYSNLGDTLKDMGELEQAAACYRKALELQPNFPEVHNNLGTLYQLQNQWQLSAVELEWALALKPDFAAAHYNLGVTRQQQRDFEAALLCYRRALVLQPDFSAACGNMGIALRELGRLDEAVLAYQAALRLNPNFTEALNNLGGARHEQKQYQVAIAHYEHALALQPDYAEAYYNMGLAYKDSHEHQKALICFQNAIHLMPGYAEPYGMLAVIYSLLNQHASAFAWCEKTLAMFPESAAAHFNLGVAYTNLNRQGEAMECFRQAIARQPDFAEAYGNLGVALHRQGACAAAVQQFDTALALKPWFSEARNNLAGALKDLGRLEEAHAQYEQAIALTPAYADPYSNQLLLMQYMAGLSADDLFASHLRYGAVFEKPAAPLQHANAREPEKRLKIGYLSPDFRQHAVSSYIEQLLAHHDKSKVEVFCYYNHTFEDAVTERIRACADHWRPCLAQSDQQLCADIDADGIDILVDLAGHTAGNRLLALARKPAPVQVTYLGYPATTGLRAIDYRISDRYAEPPGMTERYNVEQLWRLPDIAYCYTGTPGSPAVIDHAPLLDNGHVTFGCFNNYAKVSDDVIVLWAAILLQVPQSRLMMEIFALDEPGFRDAVEQRFARLGIAAERLILIAQSRANRFVLYNRIDIALDPFPCNGGTTSCDTLWMGVPFVTLAGNSFTSRQGVTILSNTGLTDLVADSPQDYIRIASELALDPDRLAAKRHNLRQRMQASPLMDIASFASNLEQAYRDMWKVWCRSDQGVMLTP